MVVLSLLTTPASAATLLFANSAPGEGILRGGQRLLTESDGTFSAQTSGAGGVRIFFNGNGIQFWTLTFDTGTAAVLAPGTYEGATRFGTPTLDVSGEATGCSELTGRFVVHEVVFASAFEVRAFAADFEQRCEGFDGALVGSIRFRSGDSACEGVPDGTPCDDADRCTAGDVCTAGVCAGRDGVSAGCIPSAVCREAGVCNPASGTCASALAADSTPCDDADACTVDDACLDGICTGAPIECDDGDPCTVDACDTASGCTHDFVPGTCWETRAVLRVSGSGSANGRQVRCSLRCLVPGTGTLLLGADGTYTVPAGQLSACPSGELPEIPDEIGTVREGRRRKLFLEPTNLADMIEGATACSGGAIRFRSYRSWVRPSRSGTTLLGKGIMRGKVPGPVPVSFKAVTVLTGAETRSGLEPALPPGRKVAECTPSSRVRCRVR